MKKYIMGNLKMNFDYQDLKKYLNELTPFLKQTKNQVVIFPSFVGLAQTKEKLKNTNIFIGAQNVSENEKGAFTGEVSAKMLKSFNVDYVLVGHSERRKHFFENDSKINQKIKLLLKYGIKPVLCVGETEKQRLQNKTNEVLTNQLIKALKGIYENELESIIVAYEPVWAIGTNKTASEKNVLEAIKHIKNVIKQNYSLTASNNLVVLYGGSLKSSNAKNFLSHKEIGGALIGGSSLKVEEFAKIILEN